MHIHIYSHQCMSINKDLFLQYALTEIFFLRNFNIWPNYSWLSQRFLSNMTCMHMIAYDTNICMAIKTLFLNLPFAFLCAFTRTFTCFYTTYFFFWHNHSEKTILFLYFESRFLEHLSHFLCINKGIQEYLNFEWIT